MRRVMVGDVLAAAQVLRGVSPEARPARIAAMLARAHAADKWRKRQGCGHPDWGNGSLMALSFCEGAGRAAAPSLSDESYLAALGVVIAALAARKAAGGRARI